MPRVRHRQRRRGAAVVECAMVLPVLFLLTFGTIEASSTIFLKEAATIAAYEGAREAVKRRATTQDAATAATTILDQRGVASGGRIITVSPNPTGAAILEPITVTVSVPTNGNTVIPAPNWFTWFGNMRVTGTVVMRKEYAN